MKNKLFYLFGAALLLCSISTFTACSEDNDEPIVEKPDDGDNDNSGDVLDLNGKYDNENLKMTYNGEELTGKKVTFTADEKLEKATILLSGVEKDLTDMLVEYWEKLSSRLTAQFRERKKSSWKMLH